MMRIRTIAAIILPLLLYGCGTSAVQGGSEFGNPGPSRLVIGTLVTSNNSSLKAQVASGCPADTAIATDTAANTTSATIGDDCSLSLNLEIDKAYMLGFSLNDNFVAAMIFNNGPNTFGSPFIIVSAGETAIDLGQISISNSTATPENEPSEQNDQDGDGTNDFDDDDDDNDGIHDEDEDDCDLDGAIDDIDEDDCESESDDNAGDGSGGDGDSGEGSGSNAVVLEVDPRNGEGINPGTKSVELDEDVELRVSCEVDPSTVNAVTLRIVSATETLDCDITIESSGKEIECHHDGNFLEDRIYTATINGAKCLDGRDIQTTSWSWKTEQEEE